MGEIPAPRQMEKHKKKRNGRQVEEQPIQRPPSMGDILLNEPAEEAKSDD